MKGKEFLAGAYIQEGASPIPGVLVAVATVGDDEDDPETRIGVRRDDEWLKFTLRGAAGLSVDTNDSGLAFVLAEDGTVVRFAWSASDLDTQKGSRALIENPKAADLGPLRRVRVLGRT